MGLLAQRPETLKLMTLTALSEVLESRKTIFSERFRCENRADFANLSQNPSWTHFWSLWPLLSHFWAALGLFLVGCCAPLGALGLLLGAQGTLLGSPWELFGQLLANSWALIGSLWPPSVLGGSTTRFGSYSGKPQSQILAQFCTPQEVDSRRSQ